MEAAKLLSTVSALLECGYCLEKFQNPRNLPCGHTFCLSCLQSQVNNKKRQIRTAVDYVGIHGQSQMEVSVVCQKIM